MIYKTFHHDIAVSQIVLGTDVYGTDVSEETSFALMDQYVAHGGNTLDTARVYGTNGPDTPSISELTIGKWLKSRGGRDKLIISSKCAHPPIGHMEQSRLSAEEIERDIDENLQALQTDYIDILWLHRDDVSVSAEGIIDTLNRMIKKGKIRAFGGSNWTAPRFATANEYALASGQDGFCASQLKWSAATSSPDYIDDPTLVEMDAKQYAYYRSAHMPVFAYASQAKGFFYKYQKGGENALSLKARQRYLCEHNLDVYRKLIALCNEYHTTLAAATIAALTSNTDFNTVAIVGCKNTEQLADTLTGADTVLPYEEIKPLLGFSE